MAFAFEKCLVYQKAVDFSDRICELSGIFPRGFYFLTGQINRAALSVSTNIAEGSLRYCFTVLLLLFAFSLGAFADPGKSQSIQITVASPAEHQVFQRTHPDSGIVDIDVSAAGATELDARVTGTSSHGTLDADWHRLMPAPDGRFRAEITEPSGGWYRVEFKARANDKTIAESSVEHVGIGEVFVVGGQSNSTCWGEKRQQTQTNLVSSFDGTTWTLAADPLPGVDGKGGSIWPIFGDAMASKYNVPIGIVPVGAGATSVRQWLPKGERFTIQAPTARGVRQVGDHEWECDGKLFNRMVARMKLLGPNGFRAMLWHQGESDAHQSNGRTLPADQYQSDVEMIITQLRKEAGWAVPWFVAVATYHTPTDTGSPDIRAAQKAISDSGLAFAGPDTDTLTGDYRANNGKGVHMSDKGLHAHAALWVQIISAYLDKQ